MGLFDFLGKDNPAEVTRPASETSFAGPATALVEKLLDVGIDGKGSFDSAEQVAAAALRKNSNAEGAIDAIVNEHLRLAAAGGFITGLSGFITLPVALPANVVGFYILATRMSGAIAAVRGYDLVAPELRSAVLLSLVGADSQDLLKKAGYASTGRLANLAAQRLPGPVMMAVNKGVGFRLLTQFGRKTFMRFGRAVPVIGGVVGAGMDAYMLKQIADHVRLEFPPKANVSQISS